MAVSQSVSSCIVVTRLVSLGDEKVEPLQLHDLIEKVVLLRHALYKKTGQNIPTSTYCNSVLGDKIRYTIIIISLIACHVTCSQ